MRELDDKRTAENPRQPLVVGTRKEVPEVNRTLAEVASLVGGGAGAEPSVGLQRLSKSEFQAYVSYVAPQTGSWVGDVSRIADTSLVIGRGQESVVYLSWDGRSVIKVNNLMLIDAEHSPLDFFNGIKVYNELRPDTRLDVIGFTENDVGNVCAVLSQPYVRALRMTTQPEIDRYLKECGFAVSRNQDGRIVHMSADFTILDAEPRNVLVGKDGELYFVDLIVSKLR